MLSKNKRGYDENAIPQHKRFRQNLADAYLAGQVTAARAASLFTDAEAAGPTGVEDLARLGGKNANRSLQRKLLKQHYWPKLYWSKIPCWNPKKQIQEMVEMPFLLPHEVVAKLFEHGDANFILSRAILEEDRALLRAHAEACEPATILPLGLWSDGVPCNWDRSQSLEIIALTLPSIPGYRFPLFCIKKAQVKQTTMDSALQVLVWSFQQMALGLHPNRRHDGSNFHAAKKNFASIYQGSLCHWDSWRSLGGIGKCSRTPWACHPTTRPEGAAGSATAHQTESRSLISMPLGGRTISINGIFS